MMLRNIVNGARSMLRVTKRFGRKVRVALLLSLFALCVGGTPALAATGFTDNADGTVTDQATGLIWMRCAQGQAWSNSTCSGTPTSYSWSQASALSVTFAGSSAWRLPSIGDLQTIVDSTTSNPTINAAAFPNAPSSTFWSSTADSNNANNAMYVSFIYGNSSSLNKAWTFYARLVRGTASTTSGATTGGTTAGAGSLSVVSSLDSGWNLLGNSIGTPLAVATLYGDANIFNSVWKWDTTASVWQFYSPSMTAAALLTYATGKGYGVLTTINPGEGYWVNSKSKTTLAAQTGAPFSLAASNLIIGWNLVATSDDVLPAEFNRRLSPTPPGPGVTPTNFTTLWTWDNPTSNWYFYAPGLDAAGTLASYVASKGYLDFSQRGKTLGNGTGFWVNNSLATVATAPSLTVAFTNNGGASTLLANTATTVTATVADATGTAVPNTIVTFSTDATLGTIAPATALTNAAGVATVAISPTGPAGAGTITASAQVAGTAVTGSKGYTVAATAVPSVTVTLTDSTGVSVSNVSSGTPRTANATVKDALGNPVPGAVVTFSTDATLGTITPTSATALTGTDPTNAATYGVASVTLNTASLTASGAATITATTQVGNAPYKGSIGYSVGAAVVTITTPVFAVNPLPSMSTTGVSVSVKSNGVLVSTPQVVTFSSSCANNGKAVLDASASTLNGVATASYRDKGCAGADVVTASVSGIASSAATLTVSPPTTGSIQYVSSTPSSITLKGMGGAGRQESAQLIFKVVDTGGNPLGGKTVNFVLSNTAGGASLTATSGISDAVSGQVVVGVNSGTISTSVRVTATTADGTNLTTQSDQLSITTGIADQDSFTLSATKLNIEGWNIDGEVTTITARLGDHFNNPVPDGTAVVFVAEGGQIGDTTQAIKPVGSCNTVNSACSVTLTSQNPRPTAGGTGRVTVLAYAIGTESFTDLNANGLADQLAVPTPSSATGEMIDANGKTTDMGDAFLDYNENGTRDANEPFFNLNGAKTYASPDGYINTMLCDHSGAAGVTACPAQQYTYVRGSLVIVFSSSSANITINNNATIALPKCVANVGPGGSVGSTVTVLDVNGNAMPVGTKIDFTSDNGKITSATSRTVGNTNGCRSTSATCPALAGSAGFEDYFVGMRSDAVYSPTTGVCDDSATGPSGYLYVTVTSPSGVVSTGSVRVTD